MKNRILFSLVFVYMSMNTVLGQERYAHEPGEVAFDSYDLVAFFNSQVVKGSSDFECNYQGIKLQFSTQENLDKFKSDSETYFPAYGGWCAIAMVDGTFVVPDYSLYKIQEGRLFFFQVKAFFNGLTYWNKDPDKNLFLADSNYTKRFD